MANAREASSATRLPDKLFFRIGEVARLARVEPHVLRYWEKEFPGISPKKTQGGHRVYRRSEVETILRIRQLLHVERYSIDGARKLLRKPRPGSELHRALEELKRCASRPLSEIFPS